MKMNKEHWTSETEARKEILQAVAKYYRLFKEQENLGNQKISYAGRIFDEKEMCRLTEATLDFWLTSGRFTKEFEERFAEYLGVTYVSTVNSGSSANLIAFSALTAPELGERRIRRGDEVITLAAAFPTTVAPIIQYGAVPVFADITIPQYNIDVSQLEAALSERTKAVFIAHTLGNPFDLKAVRAFCDQYRLWLIEDNCDALGSTYCFNGEERFTGTVGEISVLPLFIRRITLQWEKAVVFIRIISLCIV